MNCAVCRLATATEWHVTVRKDHVMAICAPCHVSLRASYPCHRKEGELLEAVGAPPLKARAAS